MPRLTPLLLIAVLLAVPSGALADRLVEHTHDEDAILVGATGVDERALPIPTLRIQNQTIGVQKTYHVDVTPERNALQVRLSYDPGTALPDRNCVRVNDLSLEVQNPRGQLIYRFAGCDDGDIKVHDRNLPTGEYQVHVSAEQGTTTCMPTSEDGCSSPGIDYVFDAKVFAIE